MNVFCYKAILVQTKIELINVMEIYTINNNDFTITMHTLNASLSRCSTHNHYHQVVVSGGFLR